MIVAVTTESGSVHWLNTREHTVIRTAHKDAAPLFGDSEELLSYVPSTLFAWPGEPMVYHWSHPQAGGGFPIQRVTTPVVKIEELGE